jgi:hypothetical protein
VIAAPIEAWRVFAQGHVPRLAFHEWRHNATQFFETALELTEYEGTAARISLAGTKRVVFGRAREEQDLRDALAADAGGGLFDLAERRCGVVWLVEREGPQDRLALVLAAAMASVGLGPILGDGRLFGVRSAREELDKLAAPYR